MVFFYTSNVVEPPVTIFIGKDKYENEELLKWGWPEDVWFHVDKVSSAHVYLRLLRNKKLEDIPAEVLEDVAQLVKANSIQGCKMAHVDIVYTMWTNLKKTSSMDIGQIKYIRAVNRKNEIVNRLNKTKKEQEVDLEFERQNRDTHEKELAKKLVKQQNDLKKQEEKLRKQEEKIKSYTSLMNPENMISNKDGYDSDDFM